MNSFLPVDYEAPKATGSYFRPQKGKVSKVRILSDAIVGWVYWSNDNKPVRVAKPIEGTPDNIRTDDEGKPERIRHFWAMLIWNHDESMFQIWEITQATIRDSIQQLAMDEDWGHPKGYDLKVKREGEGLNTEYSVIAAPKKKLPSDVVSQWDELAIDLEELYRDGNPFQPSRAVLGAAGSSRESRALRTYQSLLERAGTEEKLEQAKQWGLTHASEMTAYAGEGSEKELVLSLLENASQALDIDDIAF